MEISIFADVRIDFIYGEHAGTLYRSNSSIEAILHKPSHRAAGPSSFDAEIAGHALELLEPIIDVEPLEEERLPYSGHKIGGTPFIVHRHRRLSAAIREALGAGYRQLVQIDFPNGDDAAVRGNWPFGTGFFHVLVEGDCNSWAFFWEE